MTARDGALRRRHCGNAQENGQTRTRRAQEATHHSTAPRSGTLPKYLSEPCENLANELASRQRVVTRIVDDVPLVGGGRAEEIEQRLLRGLEGQHVVVPSVQHQHRHRDAAT